MAHDGDASLGSPRFHPSALHEHLKSLQLTRAHRVLKELLALPMKGLLSWAEDSRADRDELCQLLRARPVPMVSSAHHPLR